jgi:hypothetical protein
MMPKLVLMCCSEEWFALYSDSYCYLRFSVSECMCSINDRSALKLGFHVHVWHVVLCNAKQEFSATRFGGLAAGQNCSATHSSTNNKVMHYTACTQHTQIHTLPSCLRCMFAAVCIPEGQLQLSVAVCTTISLHAYTHSTHSMYAVR